MRTPGAVSSSVASGIGRSTNRPRSASDSRKHASQDTIKRALDISLASVLLVVLSPVLLLAAVLISCTTGDNPFYRQRRVGRYGVEFTMLKLRTMRRSSDGIRRGLGAKEPDDVRITAIGRLLRRTSIDEVPQLLNVLAGQMSLVGPRPNLPEEVGAYAPAWRRRLSVKPGLSGLWQVSGRSEIGIRRWMAMDLYYVRHRSLLLDLNILARTVGAVLSMRGAW